MSHPNLIHRVILKKVLGWLSEKEIREFQAIMFIGCGDHAPENFTKALQETWEDPAVPRFPTRLPLRSKGPS